MQFIVGTDAHMQIAEEEAERYFEINACAVNGCQEI